MPATWLTVNVRDVAVERAIDSRSDRLDPEPDNDEGEKMMSIKRAAIIAATTAAVLSLALPAHAQEPTSTTTTETMPVSTQMCQAGGGTVSGSAGMGTCSGGAYGGRIIMGGSG
ncbi:MAG: hypothetical protein ACRDYA_02475 [Egibacteraceae bacterium]